MTHSLFSFLKDGKLIMPVILYGYSSRGIPGIEIIGLGNLGKIVKEKIIFLTKKQGIQLPLKKYVLCVDLERFPQQLSLLRSLELPLLILYWSMANILPIKRTDDCFVAGCIGHHGVLHVESEPDVLRSAFLKLSESYYGEDLKNIGFKDNSTNSIFKTFDIKELFSDQTTISFETKSKGPELILNKEVHNQSCLQGNL